MKYLNRSALVISLFFGPLSFAFTDYTTPYPTPKGKSCWTCTASDSKTIWSISSKTKSQSFKISLQNCKKETNKRKSSCKSTQCYEFTSYGVCNSSSSYAVYTPPDDVYYPPTPSPEPDDRCGSNHDCSGFDICVSGKCIDKNNSDNRCSSGMDCGFPNDCVNGRCGRYGEDGCRGNHDCSGFNICVSGQCVSQDSFQNRCFSDFDCPTFHTCSDGRCVGN